MASVEAFEAGFGIEEGLEDGAGGHLDSRAHLIIAFRIRKRCNAKVINVFSAPGRVSPVTAQNTQTPIASAFVYPLVPIALGVFALLRRLSRKSEETHIRRTAAPEELPRALADMRERHAREDRKRELQGCLIPIVLLAGLGLVLYLLLRFGG